MVHALAAATGADAVEPDALGPAARRLLRRRQARSSRPTRRSTRSTPRRARSPGPRPRASTRRRAAVVAGGAVYAGGRERRDRAAAERRRHDLDAHRHALRGRRRGRRASRVYLNDITAAVALRRSDGLADLALRAARRTRASASGEPAVRDGRVYLPGTPQGAVLDAATGALVRRPVDPRGPGARRRAGVHARRRAGRARARCCTCAAPATARRAGSSAPRRASRPRRWSPASTCTRWASAARSTRSTARRGGRRGARTRILINYAGSQVEPGGRRRPAASWRSEARSSRSGRVGRPGCDYYGVSIPGYHGTGSDREPASAGAARERWRAPRRGRRRRRPPASSPIRASSPPRRATRRAARATRCWSRRDGATLRAGRARRAAGRRRSRRAAAARRPAARARCAAERGCPGWSTTIAARIRRAGAPASPCVAASGSTTCGRGSTLVLRRGGAESFEYDLVVAPGAGVGGLALEFRGGARPRLDGRGRLVHPDARRGSCASRRRSPTSAAAGAASASRRASTCAADGGVGLHARPHSTGAAAS